MPMTKHQKIDKLARLCEGAATWGKTSELQVFILHESKDRLVSTSGYYSADMLVNLAYWLAKEHPEAISRARMVLVEEMGATAVKEKESAVEDAVSGGGELTVVAKD